jgi:hypothetical protein
MQSPLRKPTCVLFMTSAQNGAMDSLSRRSRSGSWQICRMAVRRPGTRPTHRSRTSSASRHRMYSRWSPISRRSTRMRMKFRGPGSRLLPLLIAPQGRKMQRRGFRAPSLVGTSLRPFRSLAQHATQLRSPRRSRALHISILVTTKHRRRGPRTQLCLRRWRPEQFARS